MKQKIFTLLTALVLSIGIGWAQESPRKAPQAIQYTTDKVASSGVSASIWSGNNNIIILNAGKKNSNGYLQMPIYAPAGYRDANNVPYAGFYTTNNTCYDSNLTYGQVWADLNCDFRGQVKLYNNWGELAYQFLFKGGQTVRIRKSGPNLSNVYVIYDGNTYEYSYRLGNTTIRYQAGTNNTTTYGSYDINVANSVVDKSDASNYIFESVAANSDGYSVRVQVPKSVTNLNSIAASLFQGYNYLT